MKTLARHKTIIMVMLAAGYMLSAREGFVSNISHVGVLSSYGYLFKDELIPSYQPAAGVSPEASFIAEAGAKLEAIEKKLSPQLDKLAKKYRLVSLADTKKVLPKASASAVLPQRFDTVSRVAENDSAIQEFGKSGKKECLYEVLFYRFSDLRFGQDSSYGIDMVLSALPAKKERLQLISQIMESVNAVEARGGPDIAYAAKLVCEKPESFKGITLKGDVYIRENNQPLRGTLAKETIINNMPFAQGTDIVFWPSGIIFEGTIAHDTVVNGNKVTGGSKIQFDETGKPAQ